MRSFKFYTICLILLTLIFTTPAYAKNYLFPAYDGATGGTAGKLDNIDQCNADGAGYDLQNKDAAIVWSQAAGRFLFYIYDSSSSASEVDPDIIAPDYCDEPGAAGNGRWMLVSPTYAVGDYTGSGYFVLGTGPTISDPVINFTSVGVTDCKDEDNMASNSATMLATQQSIKAYVDNRGWGVVDDAVATAKVCGDANPEGIAHRGFYDFSNVGAYTITDFEDADGDHTDYNTGDWFIGKFNDVDITVDFTGANIEGNAGVSFTASATQSVYILFVYESARWNAVNFTSGYSTPTTLSLSSINMGSGTLEIPNDESADKALANMGEVHIRGDKDIISAHFGAGGEVAGEASISALSMFTMPIDFTYVYDRDTTNQRIHLMEVNDQIYPYGIIIDYIRVTYTRDPTTEVDADFMKADDIIGVANATKLYDVITVNGSFISDTDTALIAAGQDLYLEIQADPVDEDVLANIMFLFHAEAD